ncbi:zinc finger protein Elbow isoform X1 [Glossina fuscipes]|uniref:Zinc finger protein Elbow isoform X1 n=4 Tax=Nemorhina TaxID=44051 RepID=A0A8U0WFL0_9MUSC|nr:zinc finger protein Elbow isoform X1 [Glossina fuscipes]
MTFRLLFIQIDAVIFNRSAVHRTLRCVIMGLNYEVSIEGIPQLDTKSSPLALLAQTCSAIGADTTNPKLLAANIEKATKAHKSSMSLDNRDKLSPLSNHSSVSTGSVEQQQIKSSFKPYESNNNHIRLEMTTTGAASTGVIEAEQATNLSQSSSSHRVKTPKTSNNSTNGGGGSFASLHQNGQTRCDSNQSATSQRESPAMINGNLRRTPSSLNGGDLGQRTATNSPANQQRSTSKDGTRNGIVNTTASVVDSSISPQQVHNNSTRLPSTADAAALAAASKEANYAKVLHAASSANSQVNSNAAYYQSYAAATGGMAYPMELMAASALMSPHHPMFKAAALNPYLNYARLKGLEMSPNICRDPYCTGCPANPHFLNKAAGQPCPAGCPQCDRESLNKSGVASSSSSNAAAAAVAASSYHAQLAALAAASQMPYVCSWIGGDTPYCGKRFSTSDELFQHLRTHTASLPDSVLSAAAAGGIPPNHPLFSRTYPTPPLSPLSAARYHPYGKPSMLPPSLAPSAASLASLQMPPHPALAQYFSPYALYGPRMGSSHP